MPLWALPPSTPSTYQSQFGASRAYVFVACAVIVLVSCTLSPLKVRAIPVGAAGLLLSDELQPVNVVTANAVSAASSEATATHLQTADVALFF